MAIYKAKSCLSGWSPRCPAGELTQLFSGKPGSHLDRLATFTVQQRVLDSGNADKVRTLPFDWESATGMGFCNRPETEFFQGTAPREDLCPLTPTRAPGNEATGPVLISKAAPGCCLTEMLI